MQIVPYEKVEADYLRNHPEVCYVHNENCHSDHLLGKYDIEFGKIPGKYGFITYPAKNANVRATHDFVFGVGEYMDIIYPMEEELLVNFIKKHPEKYFVVDPLGYGKRFYYPLFDVVIKDRLYKALLQFDNGMLLWGDLDKRYLTS